MIKAFDRQNLKTLRSDIDAAFAEIRRKHGVSLQLGNISFSAEKATSRLTMIAIGDPTAASDPNAIRTAGHAAEFKALAMHFGLKAEHLGATIKHGRDSYKLVGLNSKAPKFCVIATRMSDGKTYRLPESSIRSLQSAEYKESWGIDDAPKATAGTCSNDTAYDEKFNPIGKCNRSATTSRKGFGLDSRPMPYCQKCAELIDESRAEAAAEARCS